jgi:hypothetical protein
MYHFSSHVAPMMSFLLIKGLYRPAQSTRIVIYGVLMSNGCLATSLRLCVCSTASVSCTLHELINRKLIVSPPVLGVFHSQCKGWNVSLIGKSRIRNRAMGVAGGLGLWG